MSEREYSSNPDPLPSFPSLHRSIFFSHPPWLCTGFSHTWKYAKAASEKIFLASAVTLTGSPLSAQVPGARQIFYEKMRRGENMLPNTVSLHMLLSTPWFRTLTREYSCKRGKKKNLARAIFAFTHHYWIHISSSHYRLRCLAGGIQVTIWALLWKQIILWS